MINIFRPLFRKLKQLFGVVNEADKKKMVAYHSASPLTTTCSMGMFVSEPARTGLVQILEEREKIRKALEIKRIERDIVKNSAEMFIPGNLYAFKWTEDKSRTPLSASSTFTFSPLSMDEDYFIPYSSSQGAFFYKHNIAGEVEDLWPGTNILPGTKGGPCIFLKVLQKETDLDVCLFLYGQDILGTNVLFWTKHFAPFLSVQEAEMNGVKGNDNKENQT